jgi:gp16 family phage-associated protein
MYMYSASDRARIRAGFFLRGESIAAWARNRGFTPNMVYQVLSGRCHAGRGTSHQIAVALGLKPDDLYGLEGKEALASKEGVM